MKPLDCMLISPASIFDPLDPFTTGVVYMPIGIAYGASILKQNNIEFQLIDMFGESPKSSTLIGDFVRLGLSDEVLVRRLEVAQPNLVIFYANQVLNHEALISTIRFVRENFKTIKIGVAENTQAVTAYLLSAVSKDFFDAGVDFLLTGELENSIVDVVRNSTSNIDCDFWEIPGMITKTRMCSGPNKTVNLDSLPFPDWSHIPLENYWKLRYAHGPFETKSYLPILTSRGCPFPCRFCVVPSTNNRKWRARSAKSVVDEIQFNIEHFNVREFHVEDLNPTIQDSRMQEISREIISRNLRIIWKIVAGTKVESIKSLQTLHLMRESGLNYLSISPESGSKRILKLIGKPFDVNHALGVISECSKIGIRSQACFVLGFPDEKFLDRTKTVFLLSRLTIKGLDEAVLFVISPIPGSEIYDDFQGQFNSLSSLNFSPRWRIDFFTLQCWRFVGYFIFLVLKLLTRPKKIFKQLLNFLNLKFETKMEMTPYRGFIYWRIARNLKKQRKTK